MTGVHGSRVKNRPPARLQASRAPPAGLIPILIPCQKSPEAPPLPPAVDQRNRGHLLPPRPPLPPTSSTPTGDLGPPRASPSSAAPRATPASSHACRKATNQLNRRRPLPIRSLLAAAEVRHGSSSGEQKTAALVLLLLLLQPVELVLLLLPCSRWSSSCCCFPAFEFFSEEVTGCCCCSLL